jgi:hypothetical protein
VRNKLNKKNLEMHIQFGLNNIKGRMTGIGVNGEIILNRFKGNTI